MKKLLILALLPIMAFVVGCSDDDPVGPTPTVVTEGSTWNAAGGYWSTILDASDVDDYKDFSFIGWDATTSTDTSTVTPLWSISFRREKIKLNGGGSATGGGDAEGTDLGAVSFADVTVADTAGASWVSDEVAPFIDNWYTYSGPPLHQLAPNGNVYSMVDASGDHYVKFQIDSLVGADSPPDMGTVHITYFYQSTSGSTDMSGAVTSTSFEVESGTVYFDFSSGSTVTPATPSNSSEWDLAFTSYDILQNSGPSGTGNCVAFQAFTELTDPTNIDEFTAQPAVAPMFDDAPGSALAGWYTYDGVTHHLSSDENVYLIHSGDKVYKLIIETYYANIGGAPTSGWYTFTWAEL